MATPIPDCYDPALQDERRQAAWDRFMEELPVCAICRKTLLPGEEFRTASCVIVCAPCLEELIDNTETVEKE